MTYDSLSDLTSITDAGNNTTQYHYDAAGNLLSITYPDGTQQSFTYDPLGNLTETIEQNGDPVGYQYNAQGLVTAGDLRRRHEPDLHLRRPRQHADGEYLRCRRHAHRHHHADVHDARAGHRHELTSITYPDGQYLELHLQRPRASAPRASTRPASRSTTLRYARPAVRADRRLGQPDRPVHLQQPRPAGEEAQRQRHVHDLRLRRGRRPDQRDQLRPEWHDGQFLVHLHLQPARRGDHR